MLHHRAILQNPLSLKSETRSLDSHKELFVIHWSIYWLSNYLHSGTVGCIIDYVHYLSSYWKFFSIWRTDKIINQTVFGDKETRAKVTAAHKLWRFTDPLTMTLSYSSSSCSWNDSPIFHAPNFPEFDHVCVLYHVSIEEPPVECVGDTDLVSGWPWVCHAADIANLKLCECLGQEWRKEKSKWCALFQVH